MQILNPLLPLFTFPIPIDITKFTELTGGIHTDMLRDAPTRVSIREGKTFNTQRTMGTWVSAHWGENIPQMEVAGNIIDYPGQEGITALSFLILRGLYRLDKQPIKKLVANIMQWISTVAIAGVAVKDILEKNFTATNNIVNSSITTGLSLYSLGAYIARITTLKPTDLSPTYIMHDNYIYQGYFTDFQYTRDIQNPRFINYSLRFNIDWNSSDALIDWVRSKDTVSSITSITGI